MKISEDGNQLEMRQPDNWHAHFRQGELLQFLVPVFIMYGWCGRVVAEPNTVPPILTGAEAVEYGKLIHEVAYREHYGTWGHNFEPVVTIQITEQTTPEIVRDAHTQGVRVCKVYPRYVTTHSENGVVHYRNIYPALQVAEELGMVVQFHPEHPSYDVVGRLKEEAFIGILEGIHKEFPRLKISVEHVSSKAMVYWVKAQDEMVGASVTVHHLYQTADDLAGYSERSGGLCLVHDGAFKPGAKDPEDRAAILEAVLSGNPKFWYGGDDAWHLKSKKHCARVACGAGNTIASISLLISLFEKAGQLDKLEPFLSEHGAKFYGYPISEDTITLERHLWVVPNELEIPELKDSAVPFYAGETMEWAIDDTVTVEMDLEAFEESCSEIMKREKEESQASAERAKGIIVS